MDRLAQCNRCGVALPSAADSFCPTCAFNRQILYTHVCQHCDSRFFDDRFEATTRDSCPVCSLKFKVIDASVDCKTKCKGCHSPIFDDDLLDIAEEDKAWCSNCLFNKHMKTIKCVACRVSPVAVPRKSPSPPSREDMTCGMCKKFRK